MTLINRILRHGLSNRNSSTTRHLLTQTWPSTRSKLSPIQNKCGELSLDIKRLNIFLHLVPRSWASFPSEGSVASVSTWRHISEASYRHSHLHDHLQSKFKKTLNTLTSPSCCSRCGGRPGWRRHVCSGRRRTHALHEGPSRSWSAGNCGVFGGRCPCDWWREVDTGTR